MRRHSALIGDRPGGPGDRLPTQRRRVTFARGALCLAATSLRRALRRRLVDLEALLLARDGAGAASIAPASSDTSAASLVSWASIAPRRSSIAVAGRGRSSRAAVEPVDAVLDALEPLGDGAQPARQALDVGRGRDVQRAQRGLLRLAGALARLERPGDARR